MEAHMLDRDLTRHKPELRMKWENKKIKKVKLFKSKELYKLFDRSNINTITSRDEKKKNKKNPFMKVKKGHHGQVTDLELTRSNSLLMLAAQLN